MAAMTEDKDDLIRQLVQRLRETVDENDKLKALVANLTEGATAHTVLQSLYRDPNQPTGHRIKAVLQTVVVIARWTKRTWSNGWPPAQLCEPSPISFNGVKRVVIAPSSPLHPIR